LGEELRGQNTHLGAASAARLRAGLLTLDATTDRGLEPADQTDLGQSSDHSRSISA
jgi:hypothetical protein